MSSLPINDYLQLALSATDKNERQANFIRLQEFVRAENLIVDQHLFIAHQLMLHIPNEKDAELRAHMFSLIEFIIHKDLAVLLNIDPLIELFETENDALIAATLLLFPLAVSNFDKRAIATKLLSHPLTDVSKNAEYALKYMCR